MEALLCVSTGGQRTSGSAMVVIAPVLLLQPLMR